MLEGNYFSGKSYTSGRSYNPKAIARIDSSKMVGGERSSHATSAFTGSPPTIFERAQKYTAGQIDKQYISDISNSSISYSSNPSLISPDAEKRDMGIGAIIIALLIGGLIGGALVASSNSTLNPETKEIYEKNKYNTSTTNLEASLSEGEKVSEEDKNTLLSAIVISSIYNSKNLPKEVEKGYSKAKYLDEISKELEEGAESNEERKGTYNLMYDGSDVEYDPEKTSDKEKETKKPDPENKEAQEGSHDKEKDVEEAEPQEGE